MLLAIVFCESMDAAALDVDAVVVGIVPGELSPPSVAPQANPESPARMVEVRGTAACDKNTANRERWGDMSSNTIKPDSDSDIGDRYATDLVPTRAPCFSAPSLENTRCTHLIRVGNGRRHTRARLTT